MTVIERLLLAMVNGEPELVPELLHPEVVWEPTMWSGGEVFRGPAAVQRWLDQFGQGLANYELRVEKVEQAGDRGAVLGSVFDSRAEETIGVRVAWSFELENGLLRHGKAFQSWDEAAQAAGLS
jgi:SnoaL-like protein